MSNAESRRDFLKVSAVAAGLALPALHRARAAGAAEAPIPVVVWDEQQPAQKQAYDHFLGNAIADHLRSRPGLAVQSVSLGDPEHGLAPEVLDGCRVLIWWGHVKQTEVTPEVGKALVRRIKEGTLALITLHSAHWSTPFVEAMNERARLDAAHLLHLHPNRDEKIDLLEVPPPKRYTTPKADARLTPCLDLRKYPDRRTKAYLNLPLCCFPAYSHDGKPSEVRALIPDHPLAEGVPAVFTLPQTEMYNEPFHVPPPDEVVFEERWESGDWFRSGMVWRLGKGRVFYFRPGHETFPIYKNPIPLKILENAVRWLGAAPG